jgi:hypothetical protein
MPRNSLGYGVDYLSDAPDISGVLVDCEPEVHHRCRCGCLVDLPQTTSGQMTPLRARVRNQTWCGSRPHETAERTSLGWEDGDAITVDLEDYH